MAQGRDKLRVFSGAVAIVTGGASGIGRALSEELALRGCEVVLADLQIGLAREAASRINATGGKASAIEVDVADASAVEALVEGVVGRTGRLDYMFNNAGIGVLGEVRLHSIDDWNHIIDVNLRGVIHGVQAAYATMVAQGYGHIVNTASMAGLWITPWLTSYATTKYAVVGLSLSLRVEAAFLGIRVSVLCPGVIRTPILEGGRFGRTLVTIPPEVSKKEMGKIRAMDAGVFAKKALDAVARNRAIIIVPAWWRVFWWIHRLSPSLSLFLAQQQCKAAIKKFASSRLSRESPPE